MACNSREIRWTPKLSANFGFHPTPFPPGPGSTSMPALIEREFTPWSSTPRKLESQRIDKLHATECQQQRAIFSNGRLFRTTFLRRKQHVGGLLPFSAAFFHVQHEVILQD